MGVPGSGYGSFDGRVSLTTSIRMSIALALVARLSTIPGWNAQLRSNENGGDFPVIAVVFFEGEAKRIATNDQYLSTMPVSVFITGRLEDADPIVDEGNPYRYLDRLVTLAEKKIHSPDEWGLNPGFTDVSIEGHEVRDPDENNPMHAVLRLSFTYRHNYQNPEA